MRKNLPKISHYDEDTLSFELRRWSVGVRGSHRFGGRDSRSELTPVFAVKLLDSAQSAESKCLLDFRCCRRALLGASPLYLLKSLAS